MQTWSGDLSQSRIVGSVRELRGAHNTRNRKTRCARFFARQDRQLAAVVTRWSSCERLRGRCWYDRSHGARGLEFLGRRFDQSKQPLTNKISRQRGPLCPLCGPTGELLLRGDAEVVVLVGTLYEGPSA